MVARALGGALDPWWVIAGAAAALHGAGDRPVRDVDVLTSERDAQALADSLGLTPAAGAASGRFRSATFARWSAPPLPVEIMAGFHVRTGGRWVPVAPVTRIAVPVAGGAVFVPERAELRAMLLLFGRAKDRARAERL